MLARLNGGMRAAELRTMDAAFLSAIGVLAGSALGSLTSIATSWLSHHQEFRARLQNDDLSRRDELYRTFIEEASRMYADALEHNEVKVSTLVSLYALVNRMRVRSSPQIVDTADRVVRVIVETYLAPNRTLRDVRDSLTEHAMDPLLQFSDACREELQMLQGMGAGWLRAAEGTSAAPGQRPTHP